VTAFIHVPEDAYRRRLLRLDKGEAAAVDHVRIARLENDIPRVVLQRYPQRAARDPQRRSARLG
jgi:hypothetical protein